jgi:hypothetical protein
MSSFPTRSFAVARIEGTWPTDLSCDGESRQCSPLNLRRRCYVFHVRLGLTGQLYYDE